MQEGPGSIPNAGPLPRQLPVTVLLTSLSIALFWQTKNISHDLLEKQQLGFIKCGRNLLIRTVITLIYISN